jgi:hypothetical protein
MTQEQAPTKLFLSVEPLQRRWGERKNREKHKSPTFKSSLVKVVATMLQTKLFRQIKITWLGIY